MEKMTPTQVLTKAVVKARKLRKMGQRQAAVRSGVSQRTLWKLESGQNVNSEIAFSVMEACGLIMTITDPRTGESFSTESM